MRSVDVHANLKRAVPYLLVVVAALAFFWPIARTYDPTIDEGVFLNAATLINRGALPYRDFVELTAPGSFYWLALWFKACGANFTTARVLLTLTAAAFTTLIFLLGRRLGGTGYRAALFVAVFTLPWMVMNSPHYDSNVLALLALLAFVGVQSRSPVMFLIPGLLLGCTDVFLQGKGLYVFAALAIATVGLNSRRQRAAYLLAGWAVPLVVVALWAVHQHIWTDMVYCLFVWPFSGYSSLNSVPYAFPLAIWLHDWFGKFMLRGNVLMFSLLTIPSVFLASVPLLAPVIAFAERRSIRFPLVIWTSAFALLASELHRQDLGHVRHGALLLIVICFTALETSSRQWMRWAANGLLVCSCWFALVSWQDGIAQKAPAVGRGGVLYAHSSDELIRNLTASTGADEQVFVYPYRPVLYFWGRLSNPTRYSYMQYGYNTREQFTEAVKDLEQKQVRLVLWDRKFWADGMKAAFPAYRQPPAAELIMEPYLLSHYHVVRTVNDVQFLERNSAR